MLTRIIIFMLIFSAICFSDKYVPPPQEVLQNAGIDPANSCTAAILHHTNGFVREAAAAMCGTLGVRSMAPQLRRLLETDGAVAVRMAAGSSLLAFGDSVATPTLVGLAVSESPSLAWDISGMLASHGEVEAGLKVANATLRRNNDDRDWMRALAALEAFAQQRAPASAVGIIGQILDRTPNPLVRARVAAALSQFNGVSGADEIGQQLLASEPDPGERERLAATLRHSEKRP